MGVAGIVVKNAIRFFSRVGKQELKQAGKAAAKETESAAVGNAAGKALAKSSANAPAVPAKLAAPQAPKGNPAVPNIAGRTKNVGTLAEVPKPKIVKKLTDISAFDGGQKFQLGKMMASISDDVFQRLKGPEYSNETKEMVARLLDKYRVSGNPIETEIMQGTQLLGRLRVEGRIAYLRIGNFSLQGEVASNNIVFNKLTTIK